jgi:hypothetical protein
LGLVTGFDADKQKSFLLLIDLTRLAHTRFYAEAYPTGAAFLDPNNAIVSTKTHLLTLRRDSEGVWECTVSPNVKSANAVGALGGLPLYRRDEVLYWGDNTVRCPDRLARVGVGNTTLVLITSSGAVYYLHTDRTLRKAAGLQMCDLVGCGTYSKGVWIAMKNGRVHTFSLGGREEDYDISLKWIDP